MNGTLHGRLVKSEGLLHRKERTRQERDSDRAHLTAWVAELERQNDGAEDPELGRVLAEAKALPDRPGPIFGGDILEIIGRTERGIRAWGDFAEQSARRRGHARPH